MAINLRANSRRPRPFARYAHPIQPRGLVVLGIGIVVALLSMSEFVAGKQHRRAVRSNIVASKFRFWRSRSAVISGSSVGPSAPQFQE